MPAMWCVGGARRDRAGTQRCRVESRRRQGIVACWKQGNRQWGMFTLHVTAERRCQRLRVRVAVRA